MGFVLYSVIRRHMKYTGRYVERGSSVEVPAGVTLPPEEELLGWYRNPEPWQDCWILFTDVAIYGTEGSHVTRIPIADITGYEFPESKRDPMGVRVETRDGLRFLRASGSLGPNGNQKDAFCLIQVILTLARRNLAEPR